MIVGFAGLEGSGKSTAANLLITNRGYERFAFADPLKRMLGSIGVPHSAMYGTQQQKREPLKQLNGKSFREGAHKLGDSWGRDMMGDDFWVNAWRLNMPGHPLIVCDDVRRQNELDMVKELGGVVIRLIPSWIAEYQSDHASNRPDLLEGVDHDLINPIGDLPRLRANLLELVDMEWVKRKTRPPLRMVTA